jgi:tRNA nucleotidyltransferase (CCA-adding enzyme)
MEEFDMIIEPPINVKLILDLLHSEGYTSYLYGACIRDSILGIKPIIWDITTNALPPDIIMLFDDHNGFSAIPAASEYGTISIVYQGEGYRVSTFRTGVQHRFSDDIIEELSHNDFTMNSIAYSERSGLIDPFNGVDDINNKVIKCTGDPTVSLNEDRVRILRAVRFEAQLGFVMDDSLLDYIVSISDGLDYYHSEKVCNELTQIMLTDKPSLGIRRLHELGLLQHLMPEIIPTIGFDTHSSFHNKDVFEHTMMVLDTTNPDLSLRLAALLHDIDKPNCLTIDDSGEGHCYGHASGGGQIAKNILSQLNFDQKTIDAVCVLIKEHMNSYDNATELSIKRLIRRIGPDNICNLFELQLADIKVNPLSGKNINRINSIRNRCWEVLSRREPLTTHDLDITGYDLMAFYSSGKEIGEALEYLLDKVILNPSLNEKDKLLALLDMDMPEPIRN